MKKLKYKKSLQLEPVVNPGELTGLKQELIDGLSNLDKNSLCQDKPDKEFMFSDDYYRNLIFNGKIDEVSKIQLEIEVANTQKPRKMDIWNYFRYHISSMKKTKMIGIQIYILIKDKTSGKYLGIISLTSDYNGLSDRDKYIGWTDNKVRYKNIKYSLNISTCVPLQPFGFNFTGGKLLAMIAFSREVSELFLERMRTRSENPQEYPILHLTTTSLYGKSIQYDKVKYLKLVGYTKGYSAIHIPDELFDKCKRYCQLKGIKLHNTKHGRGKLVVFKQVLPYLNLPRDVLIQEYKRGIYSGFLYPNSKELLNKLELTDEMAMKSVDLNTLKPMQEIFQDWFQEWATRRYNNLLSDKRLISKINLNLTEDEKNANYQKKYRQKQIENLGLESLQAEFGQDKKFNQQKIKDRGLEIVRQQDKEKYVKYQRYQKKLFINKYDLEKLRTLSFDKRNIHLQPYVDKIIQLVKDDPNLSDKEISEKLELSYDSLRSILQRCKTSEK